MKASDFKLSLWNWLVIFCKGKFGGGITSVIDYVLNLFNDKILSKVDADKLEKFSGLVAALADFGEKVLDIYLMDTAKRTALTKTVETLRKLAESLEDGKVTSFELDNAIEDVIETIKAWKNINTIEVDEDSCDGEDCGEKQQK